MDVQADLSLSGAWVDVQADLSPPGAWVDVQAGLSPPSEHSFRWFGLSDLDANFTFYPKWKQLLEVLRHLALGVCSYTTFTNLSSK